MGKLPVLQIALRKRIFSPRVSLYIALPQLVRGIVHYLRSRGERPSYFSVTAAATAQHPGNSYLAISLQSISSHIVLHPSFRSRHGRCQLLGETGNDGEKMSLRFILVFWFKSWKDIT